MAAHQRRIGSSLPSMAVLDEAFEVVAFWAFRRQHVWRGSARQPAEAIAIRGKSEIQEAVADDDLILQRSEVTPGMHVVGCGFRVKRPQTVPCCLGRVIQEIALNVLACAEVVSRPQQIVAGPILRYVAAGW